MSKRKQPVPERGEVLIAIMRDRKDFAYLQEQKWYRVPVESAPKLWPPKWIAFYQTKIFGAEAYTVKYYGRVQSIEVVKRKELFPSELPSARSERAYHRVRLESLETLPQPISSTRWRRIVFISTTWSKFTTAAEINDLFDDSPLEDQLWVELKRSQINAERQWLVTQNRSQFMLDFAIFCGKGSIDVETDGDTWHSERPQIAGDNNRDVALQLAGWHVLRFNGQKVRESSSDYCLPQIKQMINRLGGLSDEGIVPRKFYERPGSSAEQLSLFEEPVEYDID